MLQAKALMIAAMAILASGSAFAQRRSEADYGQGLQQSALAFAAQNQWRGPYGGAPEPSNRFIGGRRIAGRLYDEPRAQGRTEAPRFEGRRAYR